MSLLNELKDHKVLQDLGYILAPRFYRDISSTDYKNNIPSDMASIYSSGLYNLVEGVASITDKGKALLDEARQLNIRITKFQIGRGYRDGLSFIIECDEVSHVETTLTYGRDNKLSCYGDNRMVLACMLQIERVTQMAIDIMSKPMSISRMLKSHNVKRMFDRHIDYQYSYNNDDMSWKRETSLAYLLDMFFMLDFRMKYMYPSVEECAEYNRETINKEEGHYTFLENRGNLNNIPFKARVGLMLKYQNEPWYKQEWGGSELDVETLSNACTRYGLSTWKEGVMTLNNIGPDVEEAFNKFKTEFLEFFNNGRWRINNYNLQYISFGVEFLSSGNDNGSPLSCEFGRNSKDASIVRLFRMFNLTDTLVTALCKTLSMDMVTELATKTLVDKNVEGNIRDILTLMTDKYEALEKAKEVV